MPYYLYKVFPGSRFELIETFDAYRPAREQARTLRAQLSPDDEHGIRVMFAANPELAERQMAEKREARPLGEDA